MPTETTRSTPLTSAERRAGATHVFPTLTATQIERIAAHGIPRPITREVLIESGQTDVPFFVVKAGEIEIVRPSEPGRPRDRLSSSGAVHR